MPHIHTEIDYVVSAFITHKSEQVLLVQHKKLAMWAPPGGHVELNENPDQALDRELLEETGLIVGKDVYIYQEPGQQVKRSVYTDLAKDQANNPMLLRRPWQIEMHDFSPVPGHKHIALVYAGLAKITSGITLAAEEHNGIGWFDRAMIDDPKYNIQPTVRWYCHHVITMVQHGYMNRLDELEGQETT